MLDVEAVLTLDAEADTKFCFTLYHGYQVKSVTSLTKDVSVSFTQGKDLLVVQTDRPTNQLKILDFVFWLCKPILCKFAGCYATWLVCMVSDGWRSGYF